MALRDAPAAVEIFYPETDGMPLPDAFYQSKHLYDLLSMLDLLFGLRDDVVFGGDIFIYYAEGDPSLTVAPDCFVTLGVSVESFERNNTYLVWDVGKAPDFVLEIGSPSTATNDLGRKRDLYASMGVGEYWRFDPSGGEHYGRPLVGEALVDGEYGELEMFQNEDGEVWGESPTLNVELHWSDGCLRLYDLAGERWLQTLSEVEEARVEAEARAEVAESARESAEARMAELEAELSRLRGE